MEEQTLKISAEEDIGT